MGVKVFENETEAKLTAKVLSIIKKKIDVDIVPSEIVATHRIPSKHNPKHVLIKLKTKKKTM